MAVFLILGVLFLAHGVCTDAIKLAIGGSGCGHQSAAMDCPLLKRTIRRLSLCLVPCPASYPRFPATQVVRPVVCVLEVVGGIR